MEQNSEDRAEEEQVGRCHFENAIRASFDVELNFFSKKYCLNVRLYHEKGSRESEPKDQGLVWGDQLSFDGRVNNLGDEVKVDDEEEVLGCDQVVCQDEHKSQEEI